MYRAPRRPLHIAALAGILAGSFALSASAGAPAGHAAPASCAPVSVGTVVLCGLNAPRHLQFGPDRALYVAEAGYGDGSASCATAAGCFGYTSDITRIANATFTSNSASPVRWATGFPSAASSAEGGVEAIGVSGVAPFGSPLGMLGFARVPVMAISQLGPLYYVNADGSYRPTADFTAYEKLHDPDGLGVDSDPYAVNWTGFNVAVIDAAGDDLLSTNLAAAFFGRAGSTVGIRTLSVFPEYPATLPDGSPNPCHLPPDPPGGHAAPTSVVYYNGAYYVGELDGFAPGCARIWRVVPGQPQPQLVASGFSAITDIAFDAAGNLYVLQFGSGEIDRLSPDGTRAPIVCPHGLVTPTGLTVGPDGNLYVSDFGDTPAGTGEVVRIAPTPVSGGCHAID